jgi:hypothetical protein
MHPPTHNRCRSDSSYQRLLIRLDSFILHRHISLLGNVLIGDFAKGYFSSVPDLFPLPGRSYPYLCFTAQDQAPIDWDEDDGISRRDILSPMLRGHPILECAFACMPPVAQLRVQVVLGVEPMTVQNPSGVTVDDDALAAW